MSTESKLEFIELIETNPIDLEWPRTSSLAINSRSHQKPGTLRTVGELPHCYEWQPKTAKSRDRLIEILQAIEYPEFQCSYCGREESDCSAKPCAAVIQDRES